MINIPVHTCQKYTEGYIRHKYPKDGQFHPFDVLCPLQHFLYANGYTYLMQSEQMKRILDIKEVIPKAYMPFNMCERWFMVSNGNIIWRNKKSKSSDEIYKVLAFHKEKITDNYYSYEVPITKNYQEDLNAILEKSKKKEDNIYMFVKII